MASFLMSNDERNFLASKSSLDILQIDIFQDNDDDSLIFKQTQSEGIRLFCRLCKEVFYDKSGFGVHEHLKRNSHLLNICLDQADDVFIDDICEIQGYQLCRICGFSQLICSEQHSDKDSHLTTHEHLGRIMQKTLVMNFIQRNFQSQIVKDKDTNELISALIECNILQFDETMEEDNELLAMTDEQQKCTTLNIDDKVKVQPTQNEDDNDNDKQSSEDEEEKAINEIIEQLKNLDQSETNNSDSQHSSHNNVDPLDLEGIGLQSFFSKIMETSLDTNELLQSWTGPTYLKGTQQNENELKQANSPHFSIQKDKF